MSSNDILISDLITKLSVLKERHGDMVVCLNDENVGYIPLFCHGVSVISVAPRSEDGIYIHHKDGRQLAEKNLPGVKEKILVIEWSC